MAVMADSIRGDGLSRAQRALTELERNPVRLHGARRRFNDSPPPYTSGRSGTTTRSVSPGAPSERQRRREQRRMQLAEEYEASRPYNQFSAHVDEERKRIWNMNTRSNRPETPPGFDFLEQARETVKRRWVKQGIWNNNWTEFAYGNWKHEEPLFSESESTDNSESRTSTALFSFPKQPKTDDNKRWNADRQVAQEREREASRPFHQFVFQLSEERESITELRDGKNVAHSADINTKAYENVKRTWIRRKIWNQRWGIMPGMCWKHEERLEEEGTDSLPTPASLFVNDRQEIIQECLLFDSRSAGTDQSYHLPHGTSRTVHQCSADINPGKPKNSETGRPDTMPHKSSTNSRKRLLSPSNEGELPPSKRRASLKAGQPKEATQAQEHLSKISRTTKKCRRSQRRENCSQDTSSDKFPVFCGAETVASRLSPPHHDCSNPRRSKRIQSLHTRLTNDSAKAASEDMPDRATKPKPDRNFLKDSVTKNSAQSSATGKRQSAKVIMN